MFATAAATTIISARASLRCHGAAAIGQVENRLENSATFGIFAWVALIAYEVVSVDLNGHATPVRAIKRRSRIAEAG